MIGFLVIGAAMEKKSVRDMAAGLNRLGGEFKRMPIYDYDLSIYATHAQHFLYFRFA